MHSIYEPFMSWCTPDPPYRSCTQQAEIVSPLGLTVWQFHGIKMRSMDNPCQVIGYMISFPNRLDEQARMDESHTCTSHIHWMNFTTYLSLILFCICISNHCTASSLTSSIQLNSRRCGQISMCRGYRRSAMYMSYTQVYWLWYQRQATKNNLIFCMEIGSIYLIWKTPK